eukprot:s7803_g2.t1
MLHQNYYLSVGAMMAMVGLNDDARASSSKYLSLKKDLRPGLGGTIVPDPDVAKERDELAGQFRTGKTFLLTDLRYRCASNKGGLTNIQAGLEELGYQVAVIDINSFKSAKSQKILDAIAHLKTLMDMAKFDDNDSKFHGIESGIHAVAMETAEALQGFGIMVTTADGLWRLLYAHAGNHWNNNDALPERMEVFATIEKHLFRQRILLMCSVKAEQAKELNMLVQKSSLQVGVDLEQLEEVLKAPTVVDVGYGGISGAAGEATSSDQRQGGSVGGSHRNIGGDYEKAP